MLIFPVLISAVLLEGMMIHLPITLVCLLCWAIAKRDASVFLGAFFAGIVLDIFALRAIGSTSLFFLLFIFLILLYQKKYEINSYPFVFVASFLGSLGFLGVFGYGNIFFQALITSVLALLFFTLVRYIQKI